MNAPLFFTDFENSGRWIFQIMDFICKLYEILIKPAKFKFLNFYYDETHKFFIGFHERKIVKINIC